MKTPNPEPKPPEDFGPSFFAKKRENPSPDAPTPADVVAMNERKVVALENIALEMTNIARELSNIEANTRGSR
jgi:hypothetical protein